MTATRSLRSILIALAVLALAIPAPLAAQTIPFANPSFQANWQRYDEPVQQGQTNRSWTWGPTSNAIVMEPYANSPGGQRQVQYFDKARMELNNPANPQAVTNGLLVKEMVSGQIAVGDTATQPGAPAQQTVAGDPVAANPAAPTYASFTAIASLNNDNRAPNRTGQAVDQSIDKAGAVTPYTGPLQVTDAYYDPNLGHNIPNVFWTFLNQTGTVYANDQFVQNQLVYNPWQNVMGLPITEPYWTTTNLAGAPTPVLVQLYERRVLSYTPTNAANAQVEMGNVGQAYYAWRYQSPAPPPAAPPTPTLPPTQAAFTDGPEHGTITTTSAELLWETNVPTTSTVQWGTDPTGLNQFNGSSGFATDHAVTLANLTPGTIYYWRVNAAVEGGGPNLVSTVSSFATATLTPTPVPGQPTPTPAPPTPTPTPTPVPGQPTPTPTPDAAPLITSGPTVTNLTSTGATVVWSTDQPTNTEIIWGTDEDDLSQRIDLDDMTTSHSATLTPLMPNTKYYYRTLGRAQSGQGVSSAILSFTTAAQ